MFYLVMVTPRTYKVLERIEIFDDAKKKLIASWKPGSIKILRDGRTGRRITLYEIENYNDPK